MASQTSPRPLAPDWISRLFGPAVRFGMTPLCCTASALQGEERSLIRNVASGREREIATGRDLARRLLAELDRPSEAILRDEDKLPVWPEGVVGSITHKSPGRSAAPERGGCVVAVALAAKVGALGVDLEENKAIHPRLLGRVCSSRERSWAEDEHQNTDLAGGPLCRGRLLFSAKEAVYKAFFPRTRAVWSFQEVEIEFDELHTRFRAELPASAGMREVEGRMAWQPDWILTVVEVPAGAFQTRL